MWWPWKDHKNISTDSTIPIPITTTSTNTIAINFTREDTENSLEKFIENEIGGIVGLVFGLLFALALVLAAYFTYRKHRRLKNEEYDKQIKVFRASQRNAGVYTETTEAFVEDIPTFVTNNKNVYASLRQDQNLIEHDSDDEF